MDADRSAEGTEHDFGSRTSATISYAGAKGTHLVLSQGYTGTGLNLNQLPDQYDSIGGSAGLGTGLFKPVSNPLFRKDSRRRATWWGRPFSKAIY